jgi:release factor glutamine methyltransferase
VPQEIVDALVRRLRTAGCVFAEEEAGLLLGAGTAGDDLERLVARRVAGEPLEHVLGWVGFCGLRLAIEPGVFVPRTRTELLAERAVDAVRAAGPGRPVVVDLCCGCGAVAAVVAAARGDVELHAADLDPVAVRVARRNLPDAAVHEGDLYAALPYGLRGRVDVLVANVPYVPSPAIALMPAESRDHEPRATVDGGADGLDVVRRLAERAPHWLATGGTVLVETGADQGDQSAAAFDDAGLLATVHHDEDRGATVVSAS